MWGGTKNVRVGSPITLSDLSRASEGVLSKAISASAIPSVTGFTHKDFILYSENGNIVPLGCVNYLNTNYRIIYYNGAIAGTNATIYAYPVYVEN